MGVWITLGLEFEGFGRQGYTARISVIVGFLALCAVCASAQFSGAYCVIISCVVNPRPQTLDPQPAKASTVEQGLCKSWRDSERRVEQISQLAALRKQRGYRHFARLVLDSVPFPESPIP